MELMKVCHFGQQMEAPMLQNTTQMKITILTLFMLRGYQRHMETKQCRPMEKQRDSKIHLQAKKEQLSRIIEIQ